MKTIKDKRGRITKFYPILGLPQNEFFFKIRYKIIFSGTKLMFKIC